MIIRTEAIVLRRMNYGETSQIVTLFTRAKGKVTVIAKGARNIKSKFGATLQPLSYIQAVYYHKPTRDLQTLSDTTHLLPFQSLTKNLEKIGAGMLLAERVLGVTEGESQNLPLFNLLLEGLATLNDMDRHMANVPIWFDLQLTTLLGFPPQFRKQDVEQLPETGGWFHTETGAMNPVSFGGSDQKAGRATLRGFAILARGDSETIQRLALSPEVRAEIRRLADAYLKHHLEDTVFSKTREVLAQMTPPEHLR